MVQVARTAHKRTPNMCENMVDSIGFALRTSPLRSLHPAHSCLALDTIEAEWIVVEPLRSSI
jgi:hypothetical protein